MVANVATWVAVLSPDIYGIMADIFIFSISISAIFYALISVLALAPKIQYRSGSHLAYILLDEL